jgi:hypothetical protein
VLEDDDDAEALEAHPVLIDTAYTEDGKGPTPAGSAWGASSCARAS